MTSTTFIEWGYQMAKTACQSDAGFRRYKLLKSVMVLSGRVLSCLVGSGRLCVRKIPYPVRTRERSMLARKHDWNRRYHIFLFLASLLVCHNCTSFTHCGKTNWIKIQATYFKTKKSQFILRKKYGKTRRDKRTILAPFNCWFHWLSFRMRMNWFPSKM